jgi:hypothetical protein
VRRAVAGGIDRWGIFGLVAVVALSGCAPSTPSTTAAPVPTATLVGASPTGTPTATPSAEPRPTVAATPSVFESVVYPYTLTLPPGAALLNWAPATRHWDGEELVGSATPALTDVNRTPHGAIWGFGTDWTGTLEDFRDHIIDITGRYHSCSAAEGEVTFEVPAGSIIAFRQTCAAGTRVAAAVAVHKGFGLVIRIFSLPQGSVAVVLDDIEVWLQGLAWTT